MAITPSTNLKILKCPLEIDNENQINFSNSNVQFNYFNSLPSLEIDNISYQRKDNIIRYPGHIDTILEYNYCMYQNENYTNKWFYAFITNMRYISDSMTEITIKTDVFQTWQFNISYKESFIERKHVTNDNYKNNTYPENIETGPYVTTELHTMNQLQNLSYVIQVTEWTTGDNPPLATNYGGVFGAGGAYICSNITDVINILNAYSSAGKKDAVYNVYMVPSVLIKNTSGSLQYSGQDSPGGFTFNISPSTSKLKNYTPCNKKLLCYPYRYLILSNNSGCENILRIEEFNSNPSFDVTGVPTVGGSIRCTPVGYGYIGNNLILNESVMGGKYPTLSWSEDAYTNWLTQNSVNLGIGVATNLVSLAGGIGLMATGAGSVAGASSIVSSSVQIANIMGQVYEHSLIPNTARGNTNGGDINTCTGYNTFSIYEKEITTEYAKKIDKYFDMYGYKVNTRESINIDTRQNWNYIKTIGCNIEGDIPQNDLQEIKDLFNNGITIWHNTNTFLDYSQTNNNK